MIGLSTSSGQIQPVWVHAGMDSGDFPQVFVRNAGGALHFHAAVQTIERCRLDAIKVAGSCHRAGQPARCVPVVKNHGSARFEPAPQRGLALLCASAFLCASFGLFGASEAQPPQSLAFIPEPASDHSGNGHD
jgi:hypothetical protein